MAVTRRQERVASLVRNVVAGAIRDRVSDPRLEPMTSITRVEVSPDFSVAHIYVTVLANEARQKLSLAALRSATRRLRAELADHLTMRLVPDLAFHLDQSVKRGIETVDVIERAMAEIAERTKTESAGQADGPAAAEESARAVASEESRA